jgi:hypothetical protein
MTRVTNVPRGHRALPSRYAAFLTPASNPSPPSTDHKESE